MDATPLTVSIAKAAEMTGLSTRTIQRRIADGDLTVHRVGGRSLVPMDALRRFVGLEVA